MSNTMIETLKYQNNLTDFRRESNLIYALESSSLAAAATEIVTKQLNSNEAWLVKKIAFSSDEEFSFKASHNLDKNSTWFGDTRINKKAFAKGTDAFFEILEKPLLIQPGSIIELDVKNTHTSAQVVQMVLVGIKLEK